MRNWHALRLERRRFSSQDLKHGLGEEAATLEVRQAHDRAA
jgi:hypothetical protein